jgi:Xaa-Pro aminopeptidase
MCKVYDDLFFEQYAKVKDLNVKAYDRIRKEIHAGCTEKELYEKVLDTYMSNTDGKALHSGDYISGLRTCDIEGPATDKVIEKGDTIIVDALCAYEGVYCDTTRSYFCGEPSEEQKKAYMTLCKLLEETKDMLRPGTVAGDIFRYVDGRLKEEGYEGLVHHAGHGLGSSWYEKPYFIAESETVLEENMLVALEPGVYLPGKFGLRVENNYRVTKDGGVDVFGYTTRLEDFIIA